MDVRATGLFAGPFTQADAERHGYGRSVVRRLLRDGDVRRVLHGVYAAAHLADTPALRARAAARVLPPHAVVAGRSAAWLHGIALPGGPGPLEVVVPPGTAPPRRRECTGRVMRLAPDDVVRLGQVRLTSGPRTAADLGRTQNRRDAVAALDAFLRANLVTKRQLEEAVTRFAAHPGVGRLAEAVRLADRRSAGPAETALRLALLDAGLGEGAVPGHEVRSALGNVLHRFAVAWPSRGVGLGLGRPPPRRVCGRDQPAGDLPGPARRWRSIGGRSWLLLAADPEEVLGDPSVVVAHVARELGQEQTRAAA